MTDKQVVHVVDDDDGVRKSLGMLLESEDLPNRIYGSAATLLADIGTKPRGCLVLDFRMPDMNGMQLQLELQRRGVLIPIIFVSGHGDIAMAVRAMRHGALDFISKPYSEHDLLASIRAALEFEEEKQQLLTDHRELMTRMRTLSNRERQVFEHISEGLSNKETARRLDLSKRTIECHRSQVIRKMDAHSLAELVRMRLETQRPIHVPIYSPEISSTH